MAVRRWCGSEAKGNHGTVAVYGTHGRSPSEAETRQNHRFEPLTMIGFAVLRFIRTSERGLMNPRSLFSLTEHLERRNRPVDNMLAVRLQQS